MRPEPTQPSPYKKIPIPYEPIAILNLEPIKTLLMDEVDGLGWSLEKCNYIGELYRTYLYLIYMYPEDGVVPTPEIDKFWHFHILDTHKYFEDCENIFGRYIHHNPYLGLRGEEDEKLLQNKFAHTKALVKKHFPGLR